MKSTKIFGLLALLVAILAALGGGFYYHTSETQKEGDVENFNETDAPHDAPVVDTDKHENSLCTTRKGVEGQNGYSMSTAYISANGDIRSDSVDTALGTNVYSHFILLRDPAAGISTTYDWNDMVGSGSKTVTKLTGPNLDAYATGSGTMGGIPFAMDCVPWTLDSSKFVPPSNVTFVAN